MKSQTTSTFHLAVHRPPSNADRNWLEALSKVQLIALLKTMRLHGWQHRSRTRASLCSYRRTYSYRLNWYKTASTIMQRRVL